MGPGPDQRTQTPHVQVLTERGLVAPRGCVQPTSTRQQVSTSRLRYLFVWQKLLSLVQRKRWTDLMRPFSVTCVLFVNTPPTELHISKNLSESRQPADQTLRNMRKLRKLRKNLKVASALSQGLIFLEGALCRQGILIFVSRVGSVWVFSRPSFLLLSQGHLKFSQGRQVNSRCEITPQSAF